VTITPGKRQTKRRLDFAPRALVLWWSRQSHDGVEPTNSGGLGFAVAGSKSGSIGWLAEDGVVRSRTASYCDHGAVVGLVDPEARAPALRGEADFLPNGFALRIVTVVDAWRVHFLALGGDSVRACAGWVTSPQAGVQERIAVGLRPDLLLFASASGDGSARHSRGLSISFGAASSPAHQGGLALCAPDGSAPGSVVGAQRNDAAIVAVGDHMETVALARVSSVDSGGFRLAWSQTDARQVLFLAVTGVHARAGSGRSPARPGRQRVRSLGLAPVALLCFSWGLRGSSSVARIGRLSLGGASSPTESGAVSWDVRNKESALTASHVHSCTKRVLLVPDTQTGGMHATAALASFDPNGFTLAWPQSDGQRRAFHYVAIGGPKRRPMTTAARRLLSGISL
jgi:hypothetical protein